MTRSSSLMWPFDSVSEKLTPVSFLSHSTSAATRGFGFSIHTWIPTAAALPIADFAPFGPAAGDSQLNHDDDGASTAIPMTGMRVLGARSDFAYPGINGVIGFQSVVPGARYAVTNPPFRGATAGGPVVAVLWTDIDTRKRTGLPATTPESNNVFYRRATGAAAVTLYNAVAYRFAELGITSFSPEAALLVTYYNVGIYNQNNANPTSAQALLMYDQKRTYIVLRLNGAQPTKNVGVGIDTDRRTTPVYCTMTTANIDFDFEACDAAMLPYFNTQNHYLLQDLKQVPTSRPGEFIFGLTKTPTKTHTLPPPPTPTEAATASKTASVTVPPTPTRSKIPTPSFTATFTVQPTVTVTIPATVSPTTTATNVATWTNTIIATPTLTSSPTLIPTKTWTSTATAVPSFTLTVTASLSLPVTTSPTLQPTATQSVSYTPSSTASTSTTTSVSTSFSTSMSATLPFTTTWSNSQPTPSVTQTSTHSTSRSFSTSMTASVSLMPTMTESKVATPSPTTTLTITGGSPSITVTFYPTATVSSSVSVSPTVSVSFSTSVSSSVSVPPTTTQSTSATQTVSISGFSPSTSATIVPTPTHSTTGSMTATTSVSQSAGSLSMSQTPPATRTLSVSTTQSHSTSVSGTTSVSTSTSLQPTATASFSTSATVAASASASISATLQPTVTSSTSKSTSVSATISASTSATIAPTATVSTSGSTTQSQSVSVSAGTFSSTATLPQTATPTSTNTRTASTSVSGSTSVSTSISAPPTITAEISKTLSTSVSLSSSPTISVSGGTASSTGTIPPTPTPSQTPPPTATTSTSVSVSNSPSATLQPTATASTSVSTSVTTTTSLSGSVTIAPTATVSTSGTASITKSVSISAGTFSGTSTIQPTTTVSQSSSPTVSASVSTSVSTSASATLQPTATVSTSGSTTATTSTSVSASATLPPTSTVSTSHSMTLSKSASVSAGTFSATATLQPTATLSMSGSSTASSTLSRSTSASTSVSQTSSTSVSTSVSTSTTQSTSVSQSRSEVPTATVTVSGSRSATVSVSMSAGTVSMTETRPITQTNTLSNTATQSVSFGSPSTTATLPITQTASTSGTASVSVSRSVSASTSTSRSLSMSVSVSVGSQSSTATLPQTSTLSPTASFQPTATITVPLTSTSTVTQSISVSATVSQTVWGHKAWGFRFEPINVSRVWWRANLEPVFEAESRTATFPLSMRPIHLNQSDWDDWWYIRQRKPFVVYVKFPAPSTRPTEVHFVESAFPTLQFTDMSAQQATEIDVSIMYGDGSFIHHGLGLQTYGPAVRLTFAALPQHISADFAFDIVLHAYDVRGNNLVGFDRGQDGREVTLIGQGLNVSLVPALGFRAVMSRGSAIFRGVRMAIRDGAGVQNVTWRATVTGTTVATVTDGVSLMQRCGAQMASPTVAVANEQPQQFSIRHGTTPTEEAGDTITCHFENVTLSNGSIHVTAAVPATRVSGCELRCDLTTPPASTLNRSVTLVVTWPNAGRVARFADIKLIRAPYTATMTTTPPRLVLASKPASNTADIGCVNIDLHDALGTRVSVAPSAAAVTGLATVDGDGAVIDRSEGSTVTGHWLSVVPYNGRWQTCNASMVTADDGNAGGTFRTISAQVGTPIDAPANATVSVVIGVAQLARCAVPNSTLFNVDPHMKCAASVGSSPTTGLALPLPQPTPGATHYSDCTGDRLNGTMAVEGLTSTPVLAVDVGGERCRTASADFASSTAVPGSVNLSTTPVSFAGCGRRGHGGDGHRRVTVLLADGRLVNPGTVSYRILPRVLSVSGCPVEAYPSVGQCDTAGVAPLTISGVGRFTVSSNRTSALWWPKNWDPVPCTKIHAKSSTELVCTSYFGYGQVGGISLYNVPDDVGLTPASKATISYKPGLEQFCPRVAKFGYAVCSGHGRCSGETGKCTCDFDQHAGWFVGSDCSLCAPFYNDTRCIMRCPGASAPCSGNGYCTDGTCFCTNGFGGQACELECPRSWDQKPCSGHGVCEKANATCVCQDNVFGRFTAADCSQCKLGYGGANCEVACPAPLGVLCGGHGQCGRHGTCTCDAGYCAADCSSSGAACDCPAGYWGDRCDRECDGGTAPVCNGHGVCSQGKSGDGTCLCTGGYGGLPCDTVCPGGFLNPCSGHGVCITQSATCACSPGWGGFTCGVECPSSTIYVGQVCGGHGSCLATTGTCACEFGFSGIACDEICPGGATTPCNGHGVCTNFGCTCHQSNTTGFFDGAACDGCVLGYGGPQCDVACPRDTNGAVCGGPDRGVCTRDAVCDCAKETLRGFWAGATCDVCAPGYFGTTCKSECPGLLCGVACNGHGTCTDGQTGRGYCTCFHQNTPGTDPALGSWTGTACNTCADWYAGIACRYRCPGLLSKCGGHGECFEGREGTGNCTCYQGWVNDWVNDAGNCTKCAPHHAGLGCAPCPGYINETTSCTGRGICAQGRGGNGTCACEPQYSGPACEWDCAPAECINGQCSAIGCVCDDGWAGPRCDQCASGRYGPDCSGHCAPCQYGLCREGLTGDGKCVCRFGFWGSRCQNECPGYNGTQVCSNKGSCSPVDGWCTCYSNSTFGFYAGAQCERCDLRYESANCSIACPVNPTTNEVCSGRGACMDGVCAGCKPKAGDSDSVYCGSACEVAGLATCFPPPVCALGKWGPPACDKWCPGDGTNGTAMNGTACGGNGTCIDTTGECVCNKGFGGVRCEGSCGLTPDGQVCSGHGTCTSSGTCECVEGYWGRVCGGECPGGASDACRSAGVCNVTTGKCHCEWGMAGVDCGIECNGGREDPCSRHGTCNRADGTCTCDYSTREGFFAGASCERCASGFGGGNCSLPCGLHGTTVGYECHCLQFYATAGCAVRCPGLNSAAGVCSNNGVCHDTQQGNGTCSCADDYYGPACGTQCTAERCRIVEGKVHTMCNQTTGACECLFDGARHYGGPTCNDCALFFWGAECNLKCLCNGNGGCDRDSGDCECFADPERGYWAGKFCTECAHGWIGLDCRGRNIEFSTNNHRSATIAVQLKHAAAPGALRSSGPGGKTSVAASDSTHSLLYVGGSPLLVYNVSNPNAVTLHASMPLVAGPNQSSASAFASTPCLPIAVWIRNDVSMRVACNPFDDTVAEPMILEFHRGPDGATAMHTVTVVPSQPVSSPNVNSTGDGRAVLPNSVPSISSASNVISSIHSVSPIASMASASVRNVVTDRRPVASNDARERPQQRMPQLPQEQDRVGGAAPVSTQRQLQQAFTRAPYTLAPTPNPTTHVVWRGYDGLTETSVTILADNDVVCVRGGVLRNFGELRAVFSFGGIQSASFAADALVVSGSGADGRWASAVLPLWSGVHTSTTTTPPSRGTLVQLPALEWRVFSANTTRHPICFAYGSENCTAALRCIPYPSAHIADFNRTSSAASTTSIVSAPSLHCVLQGGDKSLVFASLHLSTAQTRHGVAADQWIPSSAVTTMGVDTTTGINLCVVAVSSGSKPTVLYKYRLDTGALTGKVSFTSRGAESEVVAAMTVDSAQRELRLILPFQTTVSVVSTNIFGVAQISPAILDAVGTTVVTVTGEGFANNIGQPFCRFDASMVPATFRDDHTLVCEAPATIGTGAACQTLLFDVQFGDRRTTATNVPYQRPPSAVLTSAESADRREPFEIAAVAAGAAFNARPYIAIFVNGTGFVPANNDARCRIIQQSSGVITTVPKTSILTSGSGSTTTAHVAVAHGPTTRILPGVTELPVEYVRPGVIKCIHRGDVDATTPPSGVQFSHDGFVWGSSVAPYAFIGAPGGLAFAGPEESAVFASAESVVLGVTVLVTDRGGNPVQWTDNATRAIRLSVSSSSPTPAAFVGGPILTQIAERGSAQFVSAALGKPQVGVVEIIAEAVGSGGLWRALRRISIIAGKPTQFRLVAGGADTWVFGVVASRPLVPPPVLQVTDVAGNAVADPTLIPTAAVLAYRSVAGGTVGPTPFGVAPPHIDMKLAAIPSAGLYAFPAVVTRGVFGARYVLRFSSDTGTGISALDIAGIPTEKCGPGEWGPANDTACRQCPTHGICDGGTEVGVEPGYWRAHPTATIYSCAAPHAGNGCGDDNECEVGYEGPRCGVCSSGYGRVGLRCVACPPTWAAYLIPFILLIIGSGILFFLSRLRPTTTHAELLLGAVKLFFTYVQLLTITLSTSATPDTVRRFLQSVQGTMLVEPVLLFASCEFAPTQFGRMTFVSILPMAITIVFAALFAAELLFFFLRRRGTTADVATSGKTDVLTSLADAHAKEVRRNRRMLNFSDMNFDALAAVQFSRQSFSTAGGWTPAESQFSQPDHDPQLRPLDRTSFDAHDDGQPPNDFYANRREQEKEVCTNTTEAAPCSLAAAGGIPHHPEEIDHERECTNDATDETAAARTHTAEPATIEAASSSSVKRSATFDDVDATDGVAVGNQHMGEGAVVHDEALMSRRSTPEVVRHSKDADVGVAVDDDAMDILLEIDHDLDDTQAGQPSVQAGQPSVVADSKPTSGSAEADGQPTATSFRIDTHTRPTGGLNAVTRSPDQDAVLQSPKIVQFSEPDGVTSASPAAARRYQRRSMSGSDDAAQPTAGIRSNHYGGFGFDDQMGGGFEDDVNPQIRRRRSQKWKRRGSRRGSFGPRGHGRSPNRMGPDGSAIFGSDDSDASGSDRSYVPDIVGNEHAAPDSAAENAKWRVHAVSHRTKDVSDSPWRWVSQWVQLVAAAFFVVVFVFYPAVLLNGASSVNCETLDYGQFVEPRSLLIADRSKNCDSSSYRNYQPIAVGFVIAYGIGVPVLTVLALLYASKRLGITRAHRLFYFITAGYSSDRWFWEATMFLRKALAVAAVVYINDAKAQVYCVMWLLWACLWIDGLLSPLASRRLFGLEMVSTAAVASTLNLLLLTPHAENHEVATGIVEASVVVVNCVTVLCFLFVGAVSMIRHYAALARASPRDYPRSAAALAMWVAFWEFAEEETAKLKVSRARTNAYDAHPRLHLIMRLIAASDTSDQRIKQALTALNQFLTLSSLRLTGPGGSPEDLRELYKLEVLLIASLLARTDGHFKVQQQLMRLCAGAVGTEQVDIDLEEVNKLEGAEVTDDSDEESVSASHSTDSDEGDRHGDAQAIFVADVGPVDVTRLAPRGTGDARPISMQGPRRQTQVEEGSGQHFSGAWGDSDEFDSADGHHDAELHSTDSDAGLLDARYQEKEAPKTKTRPGSGGFAGRALWVGDESDDDALPPAPNLGLDDGFGPIAATDDVVARSNAKASADAAGRGQQSAGAAFPFVDDDDDEDGDFGGLAGFGSAPGAAAAVLSSSQKLSTAGNAATGLPTKNAFGDDDDSNDEDAEAFMASPDSGHDRRQTLSELWLTRAAWLNTNEKLREQVASPASGDEEDEDLINSVSIDAAAAKKASSAAARRKSRSKQAASQRSVFSPDDRDLLGGGGSGDVSNTENGNTGTSGVSGNRNDPTVSDGRNSSAVAVGWGNLLETNEPAPVRRDVGYGRKNTTGDDQTEQQHRRPSEAARRVSTMWADDSADMTAPTPAGPDASRAAVAAPNFSGIEAFVNESSMSLGSPGRERRHSQRQAADADQRHGADADAHQNNRHDRRLSIDSDSASPAPPSVPDEAAPSQGETTASASATKPRGRPASGRPSSGRPASGSRRRAPSVSFVRPGSGASSGGGRGATDQSVFQSSGKPSLSLLRSPPSGPNSAPSVGEVPPLAAHESSRPPSATHASRARHHQNRPQGQAGDGSDDDDSGEAPRFDYQDDDEEADAHDTRGSHNHGDDGDDQPSSSGARLKLEPPPKPFAPDFVAFRSPPAATLSPGNRRPRAPRSAPEDRSITSPARPQAPVFPQHQRFTFNHADNSNAASTGGDPNREERLGTADHSSNPSRTALAAPALVDPADMFGRSRGQARPWVPSSHAARAIASTQGHGHRRDDGDDHTAPNDGHGAGSEGELSEEQSWAVPLAARAAEGSSHHQGRGDDAEGDGDAREMLWGSDDVAGHGQRRNLFMDRVGSAPPA